MSRTRKKKKGRSVYPKECDCKNTDQVIEDRRNGWLVCSRCGVIVSSHLLDETSEWRVFKDSDSSNRADPNRIGGVLDPLISDNANLATFIGGKNDGGRWQKLNQMNSLTAEDRKKSTASRLIDSFGSRMSLPRDVKLLSKELVNKIVESKEMSGKNLKVLCATVLYLAAKTCRSARPLKELCAVMDVKRKHVSRIYSEIMKLKAKGVITIKQIQAHGEVRSDIEQFAVKFANTLELPAKVVKAIQDTAKNLHRLELMYSNQPATVAACVIYSVLYVKPDEKGVSEVSNEMIAQVCQLSERNFLDQFRKTLKPRLPDLIPPTYATSEDVWAAVNR